MSYAFISGIPTAGKSYLGKKLADELSIEWVNLDDLREDLKKIPETEYWVNFYWNKDPREYLETTTCEEQWSDLVKQSEAFWPPTLIHIQSLMKKYPSAIFESVNLLPHLAKDLPFRGVYLLGRSLEETIARNQLEPRWSQEADIQVLEAKHFFECERPKYKSEAEKYGFQSFSDPEKAEQELKKMLQLKK